jgi:hypothetical protein
MNRVVFITLCCIITVISAPNDFSPYYNITIPNDTDMYDFSPDHKFLAMITSKNLSIYDARSTAFIQTI